MADPAPGDVVMSGAHEDDDVIAAADGENGGVDEAEQIDAADLPENVVGTDAVDAMDAMDAVKRVGFVDYLRSPIVELVVGNGEKATTLYAHQGLLTKSSWFERACEGFGGVGETRKIPLPNEDLDATGSFLEYLYNGEYFPRLKGDRKDAQVESDPSLPAIDERGAQLLRHARVYTLAEKFDVPALRSLSHRKIQATTSTAQGEIAYARYIYSSTSSTDTTIRAPIAAFWATRSHVLRHEAETEFREMCLEFPQFGFDVLNRVLDMRERGKGGGGGGGEVGVGVMVGGAGSGSGPGMTMMTTPGATSASGMGPGTGSGSGPGSGMGSGTGRGKKRSRISKGLE